MKKELIVKDSYTTKELLESTQFVELMENQFTIIEKERKNYLAKQAANVRLKRTSFDVLKESDLLHANDLSEQYILILQKQCVLSFRERYYIRDLVELVLQKTLRHFSDLLQKQNTAIVNQDKADGVDHKFKATRKPRIKKQSEISDSPASDI